MEKSYEQELREKLTAAQKRLRQGAEIKALKNSAPTLYEIIDGEISLLLNRAFSDKPLPYDDYLSAHGEMRGIKRIRNLLDSKEAEEVSSNQEVVAIQEQLEQFNNDKKQN